MKRFTFVKTDSGREAIVDGSYDELYGGGDTVNYALFILADEGNIAYRQSWYQKDSLEVLEFQWPFLAKTMVEVYNENKNVVQRL